MEELSVDSVPLDHLVREGLPCIELSPKDQPNAIRFWNVLQPWTGHRVTYDWALDHCSSPFRRDVSQVHWSAETVDLFSLSELTDLLREECRDFLRPDPHTSGQWTIPSVRDFYVAVRHLHEIYTRFGKSAQGPVEKLMHENWTKTGEMFRDTLARGAVSSTCMVHGSVVHDAGTPRESKQEIVGPVTDGFVVGNRYQAGMKTPGPMTRAILGAWKPYDSASAFDVLGYRYGVEFKGFDHQATGAVLMKQQLFDNCFRERIWLCLDATDKDPPGVARLVSLYTRPA